MNKKRIGVAEDDATLCHEIIYFLESSGYEAVMVEAYTTEAILSGNFHMVLLDLGLPDADGMELCKEIRRKSSLPVIIITSKDTEITELMSMNYGADDFMAKPLKPQLLIAHMEAILKRAYPEDGGSEVIQMGDFSCNLLSGRIDGPKGSQELTKNEIRILSVLSRKKGEIVTRDELMNELWDNYLFVDDNTLTVNITRLRGKLESIGIQNRILTKRGMGYQLL